MWWVFSRDSGRRTARKKKRRLSTPIGARTPTADGTPVTKRIDYGSPGSDGMEDDDSQDIVGSSQVSEGGRSSIGGGFPRPKKIDFGHYAVATSEPDVEPVERETPVIYGGPPESQGTPSHSQHYGGFSQDEMDFLTPLDQPVMHLSHPTTPSPLKKRHRRSSSADLAPNDEVQTLAHDMTHMDVVRHARHPPPSFSGDSMPSPMDADPDTLFSPPADVALLGTSAFIANGKRKLARPPRYVQAGFVLGAMRCLQFCMMMILQRRNTARVGRDIYKSVRSAAAVGLGQEETTAAEAPVVPVRLGWRWSWQWSHRACVKVSDRVRRTRGWYRAKLPWSLLFAD